MKPTPSSKRLSSLLVLAALVAGCGSGGGGGGGGGGTPIALGFQSGTSSGAEPAVLNVAVELTLTSGPLGQDVTVTVSDAGSGSATSGVDYTALAPQVVTFPAGASSGHVENVALTTLADMAVEGFETIQLSLESPTGGAVLGAIQQHTASIEDDDEATLQFTSTSTVTPDEQAAAYDLLVQITLDPGVSIENTVQVDLVNAGTGTATFSVDYTVDPAPTYVVQFNQGKVSGDTVTIQVNVLADATAEMDETVVIELTNARPGALLGPNTTHTLTITDDDVSQDPWLMAETGGGTPVMNGDLLDLGTQTLGAGPNAGVVVELTNDGIDPLSLGSPELVGSDVYDFSIEIGTSPLTLWSAGPVADLASPLIRLAEEAQGGAFLALDEGLLSDFAGVDRVRLHGFPVPGGDALELELHRVPSPWSEDGVLLVDGRPWPGGPAALLQGSSYWSGTAVGAPDSSVFLGFSPHGTRGWLRLSGEPGDTLHLMAEPGAGGMAHSVSRLIWEDQLAAAAQGAPAAMCDGQLFPDGAAPGPAAIPPTAGNPTSNLTLADCRLAVETDWQFYSLFGDVPTATAYATQLVAAVSDRYLADVQTVMTLAYLAIYPSSSDPWATPDGPGTTMEMLNEFQAAWAPGFGGTWPVTADLAHFLSGASLGGGIAYVDVLCNQNYGFSVSGNVHGAINWGTWNGTPSSLNWDFVVCSHELGHNFSAQHTHDYCPPLDECQPTCWGAPTCGRGTLMSYCHLCSGGLSNIDIEFHTVVADAMRSAVNQSCLGQSSLATGDVVSWDIRFDPVSGVGTRTATVRFAHDAVNTATPFEIDLTAEATP